MEGHVAYVLCAKPCSTEARPDTSGLGIYFPQAPDQSSESFVTFELVCLHHMVASLVERAFTVHADGQCSITQCNSTLFHWLHLQSAQASEAAAAAAASDRASAAETQVSELQARILSVEREAASSVAAAQGHLQGTQVQLKEAAAAQAQLQESLEQQQQEVEKLRDVVSEQELQVAGLQGELQAAQASITQAHSQRDALQEQVEQAQTDAAAAAEKAAANLTALETARDGLAADLAAAKAAAVDLAEAAEAAASTAASRISELEGGLSRSSAHATELLEQLSSARDALERQLAAASSHDSLVAELHTQLSDLRQREESLSAERLRLAGELETSQRLLGEREESLSRQAAVLETTRATLNTNEETLSGRDSLLKLKEEECFQARTALASSSSERDAALVRVDVLEGQLAEVRQLVEAAEAEALGVRAEMHALRSAYDRLVEREGQAVAEVQAAEERVSTWGIGVCAEEYVRTGADGMHSFEVARLLVSMHLDTQAKGLWQRDTWSRYTLRQASLYKCV